MIYKDYNDYEILYMVREDIGIFDFILNKYDPLIKKMAYSFCNNYKSYNLDYEELLQEGRLALYKAISSYDENREILFFTYVFSSIRKAMLKVIETLNNNKNKALFCHDSLESCYLIPSSDNSNIDIMIDSEFYNNIIYIKSKLKDLDSQIFELKYNGFSYKDISELLGVPIKLVDNKMTQIRKKIKNYLLLNN